MHYIPGRLHTYPPLTIFGAALSHSTRRQYHPGFSAGLTAAGHAMAAYTVFRTGLAISQNNTVPELLDKPETGLLKHESFAVDRLKKADYSFTVFDEDEEAAADIGLVFSSGQLWG